MGAKGGIEMATATLFLEDGTTFTGESFGNTGEKIGEIVFNTGMTGYQEILTDPSYFGQFVVMTYPLIGNYGVNLQDFESTKPRVFGFIVREFAERPSHFEAKMSLDSFLKENGILGIAGIDTRMLTKKIRTKGTMKALLTTNKITKETAMGRLNLPLRNNQVSQVSIHEPFTMPGKGPHIVLVDYGYKQGIVRELLERQCKVTVVPYYTTFEQIECMRPDGVLLSNGPGDPKDVPEAVPMIQSLVQGKIPLFGICLGHQLFALANGADTEKMKFGHRGSNHPVKDVMTNRIYITSQNHGYTVKHESLTESPLIISHIALNDGTVEGLSHAKAPAFSVQYHPEASPGPNDSRYLFDQFIEIIDTAKNDKGRNNMPKRTDIKKVVVIGSGPIAIGQAAEFDYAGTQACQSLREEGIEVVLVNSNPATIMTDLQMADKVYMEPLTVEFLERIIRMEKPDGILASLGGQTALNLAMELDQKQVLTNLGMELLGTKKQTIQIAEDREQFRSKMNEIGEPVPLSKIIYEVEEAYDFVREIGYPVVIRPAYTLGGTGGGIAYDVEDLQEIVRNGVQASPIHQVLLEKSLLGFKEIEYEVIRDSIGNKIVVCNMENFDPVGIHTGDSIVVAPSQTLSDRDYQRLRSSALHIVDSLQIEGGCNVQYALDPQSESYYVIEVNPRVSRSSALASKATGYPIAKISSKIALGYTLDEIKNPVTQTTYAGYEPALDYIVTKIPRWPFDKFQSANRKLGTQMKATGEVMAIGRTFEESLQKAIRSLELGYDGLYLSETYEKLTDEDLNKKIKKADDERLWCIAEAFRRGKTVEAVHEITDIDSFFLVKIKKLVDLEQEMKHGVINDLTLLRWKRFGFSDRMIGQLVGMKEEKVRALREEHHIRPVYKMVDTCAAEFESTTPYYYSTYEIEDEVIPTDKPSVIVLGSGPIRIGQGIEFDYSTVHAVWAIREKGYEAVIINNNPETVSTDFNTSDRLYFEPLTFEDVMTVIEKEKPDGVIVQFGGQTAINLAEQLTKHGVPILGTTLDHIDQAEDRKRFEQLLKERKIKQPKGETVLSAEEAILVAERLGYPVLVRPSYVLGGRAMEVIYTEKISSIT